MAVSDYYQGILDEAEEFYSDPTNLPEYYTANTIAGIDPNQQAGLDAQKQWAQGTGQQLINDYVSNINAGAAGEYNLTPEQYATHNYQNPYEQQVINNATQQAVSAVNQGFGGTGTLGGHRNAQAAGAAAFNAALPHLQNAYDTQFQHNVDTSKANVGLRNQYELDNLTRREGYFGAQGQAYGLGLQPAQTLGNVGDFYRGYNQDVINEDIKRFNYHQQLPQQALNTRLGLGAAQQAATGQGNVHTELGGSDLFQSAVSGILNSGGLDLGIGGGGGGGSSNPVGDIFNSIFG